MLFRIGALSSALIAALVCSTASADEDPEAYKQLIRQAVDQYELDNFSEAKALFTEAHRVFPNARTLRGLGLCANSLRDYVGAIHYLEEALANRVRPLEPAMVNEAQAVIARARSFIGRVRVALDPPDATLMVDAWPVEHSAGLIELNPGTHELAARAPGRQSATRLVRVEPGAELNVELALAPLEVVAASPAVPAEHPGGASIAPWIVVSVSGAVAIAGGVLLGIALNDVATVEDAEPLAPWSELEKHYERSPELSAAGITMLSVGLAGVAAGITWHVLANQEHEQIALRVGPGALQLRAAW
ncbi:MAG TPA: hypothetical protein VJR89_12900 [Polyangiales bacterium]|nr:hypothetical protein [Polyangiales bacterium]